MNIVSHISETWGRMNDVGFFPVLKVLVFNTCLSVAFNIFKRGHAGAGQKSSCFILNFMHLHMLTDV